MLGVAPLVLAAALAAAAPATAGTVDPDARRSQVTPTTAPAGYTPAAQPVAAARPADSSFRVTCSAVDSHGRHWFGTVTMTGVRHYNTHGGVTLRAARQRANGQMFTITSSRWLDEALGLVLARGYTGVYSPGESSPAWSSGEYASRHYGHWVLHGHVTSYPDAKLHGCSVWA
jgi:hypothetical protein